MYEDKVLPSWALQAVGADTPATVASFSKTDALREPWPPLGSEAFGVDWGRIGRERAVCRPGASQRCDERSPPGGGPFRPYLNQKGYAYAQTLERDLRIDMRIIVIVLFFSDTTGMLLPTISAHRGWALSAEEAFRPMLVEEAWRICRGLGVGAVSVDFITDRDLQRRKVTEFSSSTG